MTELIRRIISAMSSLEFVTRTYPMLTEWGVREEDVLVHSLGCSVWNTLGQDLGFMAVSECPAPMTHGADIRTDSTWFCRRKRTPAVLIEYPHETIWPFCSTDSSLKSNTTGACL